MKAQHSQARTPLQHRLDPEDGGAGGSPEEAEARAWLEAHAHDPLVAGASLPTDHKRDHETGETIDHDQTQGLAGSFIGGSSQGQSRPVSYSSLTPRELERLEKLGHALVGQGQRSRQEMDVRVRMDRAMGALRSDQRELLRMHYYERLTFDEMGQQTKRARQSVEEKLRNAEQDLCVAIATSWGVPYDAVLEVFGSRGREGRPARDRDAERQAAAMVFEAFRPVA